MFAVAVRPLAARVPLSSKIVVIRAVLRLMMMLMGIGARTRVPRRPRLHRGRHAGHVQRTLDLLPMSADDAGEGLDERMVGRRLGVVRDEGRGGECWDRCVRRSTAADVLSEETLARMWKQWEVDFRAKWE